MDPHVRAQLHLPEPEPELDKRIAAFVSGVQRRDTRGLRPATLNTGAREQRGKTAAGVKPTEEKCESAEPALAQLSQREAEIIGKDRMDQYLSYLDYNANSVANYVAYCAEIYREAVVHHEDRFVKSGKRHYDTKGVTRLHAFAPSKFRLPASLVGVDDRRYTFAYVHGKDFNTSGRFVEVAQDGDILTTSAAVSEIMLMPGMLDFLDFMLQGALLRARVTRVEPRRVFRLVDGVPGCAKSTEITKRWQPGELVAVASRAAAQELQQKFIAAGKDPSAVRTVGSRIMAKRETAHRIYVDEGLKLHPGELVLLAELTNAREVCVYGDVNQLGFAPRVPGFKMSEAPMHWETEYRTNSYTACRDVVVLLGRLKATERGTDIDGVGLYPHGFTTSNPVTNSVGLVRATNYTDVPRVAGAKYITWTQKTKTELTRAGFKDVNTIDEFQGGRAKHVVLVRLEKNLDIALRNSRGQMVVALTRHTEKFTYVTVDQVPATEDLVRRGIERIRAVTDINTAYGANTGDLTDRC